MQAPDLLHFRDRLQTKQMDGLTMIYDGIRRKWLVLQPEELVRQLLVQWLVNDQAYNPNRMSLERGLIYNGLSKRYDLLVFGSDMRPFLLAECKAPQVALGEGALRQIATYNMVMEVPYLLLTNGHQMMVYAIDHGQRSFRALESLPPYPRKDDA